MASKKTTRRALFTSVISLILCFAMLAGTTYAWFTDEVKSGTNNIYAGNLDVELLRDGQAVTENDKLFLDCKGEEIARWEPGVVAYTNVQVANVGDLALKYQLSINATNENETSEGGYKLSQVLKIAVVKGGINETTREAVLEKAEGANPVSLSTFGVNGELYPANSTLGDTVSEEYGLVVFWSPNDNETDNLYNLNNGRSEGDTYATSDNLPLHIDLGVDLFATQLEAESDSFGPDYDAGLVLPEVDGVLLVEKDGIQYYYDENGNYVLYLVTDAYTRDTVNVPEGVDIIGDYAFSLNQNVETVVLSSTVRDLGRGFDSSTSIKKVVLNEGLEKISSRAFRSTTALEEVVIPSTVKVIEDNAFQKSGIKDITIPATVETIGETAFGASLIETVTFRGNTSIQGYAFRGCTMLRTVTMYGDDVTFIPSTLNGRNSMWFCNSESNNPNTSNITFYVVNQTVASRVKTAMGAEANNTPVYIMGEGENQTTYVTVKNAAELQNALDAATGTTVISFTADINGHAVAAQKAGVNITIDGADKNYTGTITVDGKSARYETAGLTIQNVNFVGGATTDAYIGLGASGNNDTRYTNNVTVKNCTFSGDGVVAVKSYTGGDWNLTIDGCTVNSDMHSLVQVTNVEKGLKITNCKVYSKNGANLNNSESLEMSGCDFDVKGYAVRFGVVGSTVNGNFQIEESTLKSANYDGDAVIIFRGTMTGSTLSLNNTNLVGTPEITGNAQVLVGDKPYVTSADQLATAIANGATNIVLADGIYDLKGNQKDGLTLVGGGNNVKMANTTNFAGNGKLGGIVKAVNLENMTITDTVYTQDNGGSATFTKVNFAAGFRKAYGTHVVFTDCIFGFNDEDYALHFESDGTSTDAIKLNGCEFEGGKVHLGKGRTYEFTGCDFAAGTDFQVWSDITLDGCTVDGTEITATNISTFFPNLNTTLVTIK